MNFRILTGQTPDQVVARVKRVIDDAEIVVKKGPFESHPSPVSDPESPAFARLQKTIAQVSPDAVVVPFLTVGAMDARHYVGLSPNVYRFFPLRLDSAGLERIHGTDERIAEDNYLEMVRFYAQLIRNGDVARDLSKNTPAASPPRSVDSEFAPRPPVMSRSSLPSTRFSIESSK